MTKEYYFGKAKWVGLNDRTVKTFTALRGHFKVEEGDEVTLNVLGLGFFKCYINGVLINPDSFLPLSSEYENVNIAEGEQLSAARIYVPSFDISSYVHKGDNVIALHFGGGWYTHRLRVFGLPKAIYRIIAKGKGNTAEFVSDSSCLVKKSYIANYDFTTFETHVYHGIDDLFGLDADESGWENAVVTEEPTTEYCTTDCPVDCLIDKLPVYKVSETEECTVYGISKNATGYPVLRVYGKDGETVSVKFSEELNGSDIDPVHHHRQAFTVICDGNERTVSAEFTWFGFRYFSVTGPAEVIEVKKIHANVGVSSYFECDDEVLNWTYSTFIHTMLSNMHTGHPSDCPHIERQGYTGDGQLTCHAALCCLGGEAFYRKWLQDIADCQDKVSGHVQYTAPYILSGGGPGGWGVAIVEVPYQMYRHYGDKTLLSKYYENMRRYVDYLKEHSEFGLVTSTQKGIWCLGDWCGPVVLFPDKDLTLFDQQMIIPAPMVNTYFLVKALTRMCDIAKIIGCEHHVDEYISEIEVRKNAIRSAYFNVFDDNFLMNVQGANAFGLTIGLGNKNTFSNLVKHYKSIGTFDTGIFGTDVLIGLLFEKGEGSLALDLLTNDGAHGYGNWIRNGATSFHEYWDSSRSRSHSHPMFGAPVAYFFEYLLGIRQPPMMGGYSSVIISPTEIARFSHMKGYMTVPAGIISVEYRRQGDIVSFDILIPEGVDATFKCSGVCSKLSSGKNKFDIPLLPSI